MDSGHNSNAQLKALVERIHTLEDEKQQCNDAIKDIYSEAKGTGFDTKALRVIVRRQRADQQKLAEHEALVQTYMAAMGML
jgi:uncharacterized protein (UPF0335 family)